MVPAFYQRIWFVVLAFVMAAAALFYSGMFIDARRRRHIQELLDYRKKMSEYRLLNIIGQIEPHFTNNALSAINNAILRDERYKACDHFVKFSRLISKVLDTSSILTRSLDEEMRFVRDYLDLIKFRLGDRFNFVLNVEPYVDLQRQIPKMCIQTFVENAVKHGIQNSLSPGVVEVYVSEDQDDCHIFVTDNGIGREQAARFSRGTGKGLMILDSYIEYFNQQNISKMRYAITDLKDEQGNPAGTSVEIRIPRSYVFNSYTMETNTIRMVVVDDEPHAIETLSTHLVAMNELNLVGTAANALDGFRLISKQKPDIAFLDVQLPQHNGIELAEVLRTSHPETRVIFVTAHSEFTLQALRASAFDFILKPVSRDELAAAIQSFNVQREHEKTPLKNSLSDKPSHPTRVALKMKNTIRYMDASDIALVKADGNYSDIFLSDGQKIYISQSIGQFQQSLPAGDFVKVSRSALINTKYLRELNRKCRKVVLKVDQQLLDVVVARDHFKEVEDLLG